MFAGIISALSRHLLGSGAKDTGEDINRIDSEKRRYLEDHPTTRKWLVKGGVFQPFITID